MAAIVAACVVYVPPLIGWAQQTTDQRTLLVLNDALNRYKCEGGSVNALTTGTPMPNVLVALKTAVTWCGVNHQFLQGAFTVPARSLFAKGSGTSYRFSAYNTYTAETGCQSIGAQHRIYLTTVGAGIWTVPTDWNNNANTIECIGGGGSGSDGNATQGGAGGGGGYSGIVNLPLTPGANVSYQVG